ncbi:MAG TPA: hypothetical protein PLQ00_10820, partial [Thermoguttaceae bacterium]|nr:hypothetical protein [Thermoguttaceae bacterium]
TTNSRGRRCWQSSSAKLMDIHVPLWMKKTNGRDFPKRLLWKNRRATQAGNKSIAGLYQFRSFRSMEVFLPPGGTPLLKGIAPVRKIREKQGPTNSAPFSGDHY